MTRLVVAVARSCMSFMFRLSSADSAGRTASAAWPLPKSPSSRSTPTSTARSLLVRRVADREPRVGPRRPRAPSFGSGAAHSLVDPAILKAFDDAVRLAAAACATSRGVSPAAFLESGAAPLESNVETVATNHDAQLYAKSSAASPVTARARASLYMGGGTRLHHMARRPDPCAARD